MSNNGNLVLGIFVNESLTLDGQQDGAVGDLKLKSGIVGSILGASQKAGRVLKIFHNVSLLPNGQAPRLSQPSSGYRLASTC